MKKLIATLLMAAAGMMAACAETSTNTSPSRAAGSTIVPEKKYPWVSSITAGLSLTSGNSSSELATLKFLTDKKTPADEYGFGADGAYGSANGTQNNDNIHAFGQWNHLFSERTFSYLRLEGLHDDIAAVRYRGTFTTGLGYYFIKEKETTLAGEIGPGVVAERVGTNDNTFATLRLAERFEHKFTESHARIWQSFEILPQVDKVSDYLINAEIGAEAAVSKNLNLQVCLDDAFNSEPAAGSKRNDVKLVSGISYKF
jgi:putative salt-induced outer membrane protein YdiY